MEAERRAGCRPLRRTELLEKRLKARVPQQKKLEEALAQAQKSLDEKKVAL